MQVETQDLRELVLSSQGFGPSEIAQINAVVAADVNQYGVFRDVVQELQHSEDQTPAAMTRLGVCLFLLGRYEESSTTLRGGDGGAVAQFYQGKIALQQERYDDAIAFFDAAQGAGYQAEQCQLGQAEALRYAGRSSEAMTILDNIFGPTEQTAEYLYQRGATVSAIGGEVAEVAAYYQRAISIDPRHAGALFGLALLNDRFGNDDEAMDLYQRAAAVFPAHLGTLINLGLMYEDRNDYNRAQACYRRILEVFPTEPRAALYLKDAAAGGSTYYDEDAQRRSERLAHVLNIPVTDFELSVRARNCLQKMGLRTLGDLARTTEQQLLSSKNFGETSLVEITEILASRGLRLGQLAHEKTEPEPAVDISGLSPDQQALLDRPISDLNLSVRARKCMVRLQLTTIGELIRRTGDELLECKNFGVTSLNEVREKLTELNLKLRGD
jgi:DNA-directed RNA polymerase subunit alpha